MDTPILHCTGMFWPPGMKLEEMISNADEALYYVKQNGKGYYHIHQN